MALATPQEEVLILHARVPAATPQQVSAATKIVQYIKNDMPHIRKDDKPGLREARNFLEAVVVDGVNHFSEDVIGEYLTTLGKLPESLFNLRESIDRLESAVNEDYLEVDEWVAHVFDLRPVLQEAA